MEQIRSLPSRSSWSKEETDKKQARYMETQVVKSLSCVWLFVTPWTVAHQIPPSMEFSRQEYWSGLPFPSPGDLPNPGIEPRSPAGITSYKLSNTLSKIFELRPEGCENESRVSIWRCKQRQHHWFLKINSLGHQGLFTKNPSFNCPFFS